MLNYTGDPRRVKCLRDLANMVDPDRIVTATNLSAARAAGIQSLTGPNRKAQTPYLSYDHHYLARLRKYHKNFEQACHDVQSSIEHTDDPLDLWLLEILDRRILDVNNLMLLASSILEQNDGASAKAVHAVYSTPSAQDVQHARNNLDTFCSRRCKGRKRDDPTPQPYEYDDRQITQAFSRLIDCYGFPGWIVKLCPDLAGITIRSDHCQILVPSGQRLLEPVLIRKCASEIESKVRGFCNTSTLLHRLLPETSGLRPLISWLAKSYDESAYAGAAIGAEIVIQANLIGNNDNALPSPLHLIAMGYALPPNSAPGQLYRANFSETATQLYHELRQHGYSNSRAATVAWDATYRVFRGVCDAASHDYLFTKDSQQFTGYYNFQLLQLQCSTLRQLTANFSSLSPTEISNLSTACQSLSADPSHPLVDLLVPAFPCRHLAVSELSSQESSE